MTNDAGFPTPSATRSRLVAVFEMWVMLCESPYFPLVHIHWFLVLRNLINSSTL